MNEISLEDLLNNIRCYNENGVPTVLKAYNMAKQLHENQYRQSGEPYIIHPLNVAYILSEMHADIDTICAGLLHDTLEDTNITKEDIVQEFNKDVANLVDGVTKISGLNLSSTQDRNMANTRKIVTSITSDVRVIIIKLADRLHNMRTLSFKSEFKQKENAVETMDIFVPLAYFLGTYRIKSELEDLSLKYIYPEEYKKVEEKKLKIEEESKPCLDEMLLNIKKILADNNIPNEIKVRTKNIYRIYKNIYEEHHKLYEIHDLLALKIMVENTAQCYQTLGLVHSKYYPLNSKFKDFICNPKTNKYQSLHTTVFGPDERLVQTQIRTFDMDKVASFGLATYWELNGENARFKMQENLRNEYQFFKSLTEINKVFVDNKDFVERVQSELFADKVYVHTPKGEIIELPKGSTPVDFAYQVKSDVGNTMIGAKVNGQIVGNDYELKTHDIVTILTDDFAYGPDEEMLKSAKTTKAQRKIRELIKTNN